MAAPKSKKTGAKKTGASAKRTSAAKTAKKKPPAKATKSEPTVDRRTSSDRRRTDRRKKDVPVAVERRKLERRAKVNRRRQIDPTTCERDYTPEEIEFMNALDDYKRASGRMFPTCSEILEVFKKLGYEKRPAEKPDATPEAETTEAAETGDEALEEQEAAV